MTRSIAYSKTHSFSDIILDYLSEKDFFKDLIRDFPSEKNLIRYAKNKTFNNDKRSNLVNTIKAQYESAGLNTPGSLERLSKEQSYTITTGHQLNILTGPFYSILKIASVIKICQDLNSESNIDFIPVFWMATEDHDLEEINHLYLFNKKVEWPTGQTGAVGSMKTEDFDKVIREVKDILGHYPEDILQLIEEAYQQKDLAGAHRHLIYELFKASDLIIIDGNDKALKQSFSSIMIKEIKDGIIRPATDTTNLLLEDTYKTQAYAREINLFYLTNNSRSRIVKTDQGYETHDGSGRWSEDSIFNEIETHAERFSPNVLLRPLYQEYILPNIAYIGGGGEIAYWLQLKAAFDQSNIEYPILILRQSVAFLSTKDIARLEKYGFKPEILFLKDHEIESTMVEKLEGNFSLKGETMQIGEIFDNLKERITSIDFSLKSSAEAELSNFNKRLLNLEKKVIRAQKKQNETEINRILKIKEKILPEGQLQERKTNFLQLYNQDLIEKIIKLSDPLKKEFLILIT